MCIAAYAGIAVFAFFLTQQWQFWVLAVIVGMFQGGVQALSRSHFAKIIPPEKSGEYFGLFDICGKGASFLGTMIVSVGSQLTGSANVGVGSLIVLFIVGFVLFRVSCKKKSFLNEIMGHLLRSSKLEKHKNAFGEAAGIFVLRLLCTINSNQKI